MNVGFGLLLAGLGLYILFLPRIQNDSSCDSSVPASAVQSAALADVRARKSKVCSGEPGHCQFVISQKADGTFEISSFFVEVEFFDGCVVKEQDLQVFEFGADGKLIRIGEPPYASTLTAEFEKSDAV